MIRPLRLIVPGICFCLGYLSNMPELEPFVGFICLAIIVCAFFVNMPLFDGRIDEN